ncbi:hypothetical protein SAMN05660874_01175 [Saccharopolyspora flava]|uniref:Uncharacterized protein n=1 Tax=Saccharopolyspora flava TaxID=95161 RepID=A0A1I6PWE9_9PSEU|nr:hypothetical protein SAMN05660874_01175 [Saccharopolyspora flava]
MIKGGSGLVPPGLASRTMTQAPVEQTLPMPKIEAEALADHYDAQPAPGDEATDEA